MNYNFEKFFALYKDTLSNQEDMERIISLAIKSNKIDNLLQMAFYGKFLNGLLGIVKRKEESINESVFNRYVEEYAQAFSKFKQNFQDIISEGSDFIKNIYQKKYFDLEKNCVSNLASLTKDFSYLKEFLNDSKVDSSS